MTARAAIATALATAIVLGGCGGGGGAPPVAGTWGGAAQLRRRLDAGLRLHRTNRAPLLHRLEYRRTQRARADLRLDVAQARFAVAREDRPCEGAFHCVPTPDAELANEADEDRGSVLVARDKRARARVRAAQRALHRERRLATRTRAKVQATRLIAGRDVSCRLGDGRLRLRITLTNGSGTDVDAIVETSVAWRGPDGRRAVTGSSAAVRLGRHGRREADLDAGASRRGEAILACTARLVDVRLVDRPAAASVSASCTAGGFRLRAHVYYRSDGDRWSIYRYLYRIGGGDDPDPGAFGGEYDRGAFSDVNISVVSGGEVMSSDHSPDDRLSYELYREPARVGVDRSADTSVRFEGIFDVSTAGDHHADDPVCVAATPALPG